MMDVDAEPEGEGTKWTTETSGDRSAYLQLYPSSMCNNCSTQLKGYVANGMR